MAVDGRQVAREVEGCVRSQSRFVQWLEEQSTIECGQPSLLPGWSIGHVLTHVARNADSYVNLLEGKPQYASVEVRDSDIESGAPRPWVEQVEDIRTSCERLALELNARADDESSWSATATLLSGASVPRTVLPLLRWREVEVHWVDLGCGHHLEHLDSHYLRSDLRLLEMLWRARRPIGMTPLHADILQIPPHERLGWFLGRVEVDGVPPSGLT
ncbi:MAG: maleylpyruvate isomerase family mycothiol-dependent enzyme [Ilumatobacteraceae bacterium]